MIGYVDRDDALPAVLARLGVQCGCPVLVCVGGAAGMDASHIDAAGSLFRNFLIPSLDRCGVTVVDGGTDAGVMSAMGRARTAARARFPLVGVAAGGTIVIPRAPTPSGPAAAIEPNHTHLIVVPGTRWGDEVPWLSAVANVIAADCPSATLVVNGGDITFDDVSASLSARRPVIVIAGSGGTADAIASARVPGRGLASTFAASPLVSIVNQQQSEEIVATLESVLRSPRSQPTP